MQSQLVEKFSYQKVGLGEQGKICKEPVPHLKPVLCSGGAGTGSLNACVSLHSWEDR